MNFIYIIVGVLSIILIFLMYRLISSMYYIDEKYDSSNKNNKNKIYIDGMSNEYTPHIVKYILNSIPGYKRVDNKNDADINVYHVNNNDYTENKVNIVISGEPDDINGKVDLYIGPVLKDSSNIKSIYYPQMYSSLIEHKKSVNPDDYKSPKTKFCAYMYRQKHPHRIKYFELLSKYKKVDALGDCCKNTDIPTTRHVSNDTETYNDIAVDLYKDYKFVLGIENTDKPGYFTEKMNNPLIANSIPIYWGSEKVFDYINKKRVIYIPDYTEEELLNIIKRIDNDDTEYNKIINEPMYVDESKTPDSIEKTVDRKITEQITTLLNIKYASGGYIGGLGNQLFIIYSAISYGLDTNKLPIFRYSTDSTGRPTYFNSLFKNLKTYKEEDSTILWTHIYNDNSNDTYKIVEDVSDKNICLNGGLQANTNFIHNFHKINEIIGVNELKKNIKNKYSYLFDSDDVLGIHFRLGDYKNLSPPGVLADIYYINALAKIDNLNNKKILIFTERDDYDIAEKCIKRILDENIKFTIVKTIDFDYEELIVISLCNTIISANSTFSIWAGYLSGHSNVYLPSQYKKDRYLFEGWKSVNEFNND